MTHSLRRPPIIWLDARGQIVHIPGSRKNRTDYLTARALADTKCLISGTVTRLDGKVFYAPFRIVVDSPDFRRPTEEQLRLGFSKIVDYRRPRSGEWVWAWNVRIDPPYPGLGNNGPVQHFTYTEHDKGRKHWILERTL